MNPPIINQSIPYQQQTRSQNRTYKNAAKNAPAPSSAPDATTTCAPAFPEAELLAADPVAVPEDPDSEPEPAAAPVPVADEPLFDELLVVETTTVVEEPMDTIIEVALPAVALP